MRNDSKNCADTHRRGAGWRVLTLVVLIAFTLQSFITQTHLHVMSQIGATATSHQAPHHKKAPFDEGAAACPFCQATVHAGAFFAPASPVLLLPASCIGSAAPAPICGAIVPTLTHSWHSRAPPHSAI